MVTAIAPGLLAERSGVLSDLVSSFVSGCLKLVLQILGFKFGGLLFAPLQTVPIFDSWLGCRARLAPRLIANVVSD